MARTSFPLQTFQNTDGTPLSGGFVLISISTDVQSTDGQLCEGMTLRVALDSNGTMTSIPQVWPNASLVPSGSYYVLSAYAADGQRVLGPSSVTV